MLKQTLATTFLILGLAGSAGAATVSTAAVPVEFFDQVSCTLVNVGRQPLVVRNFELIGFFGDVFASRAGIELAPRRTLRIFARGREHGSGNDPMFCQAEVSGSARQARLTICTGPDLGRCEIVSE